jgi:hypothetical protein
MNEWPPETRSRLIFVLLLGASLAALLWFSLIAPLQGRVSAWSGRVELARMKLQVAQTSIDRAEFYRQLVNTNRAAVDLLENRMAQGDHYAWVIQEVSDLVGQLDVLDIHLSNFFPPQLGDLDLPPPVPYQLGTFTVEGSAYYHSFGAFLAAFENSSPFVKVKTLTLSTTTSGGSRTDDQERLFFRLEFHTLAKTNAPSATSRADL